MADGNGAVLRAVHLVPPMRRHKQAVALVDAHLKDLRFGRFRPRLSVKVVEAERAVVGRISLLLACVQIV